MSSPPRRDVVGLAEADLGGGGQHAGQRVAFLQGRPLALPGGDPLPDLLGVRDGQCLDRIGERLVEVDEVVQPGETVFEDVAALVRGGLAGVGALGEPAQRAGGGVAEPGEVDEVGPDEQELRDLEAACVIAGVVRPGQLLVADGDDPHRPGAHHLGGDEA